MKKINLLAIFLFILASFTSMDAASITVNPSQSKIAQQASDMPYIQYLSRAHDGIVIERADGSDTHILAQGLIPKSHNAIMGPGWSDDGQWFAFFSAFMECELPEYDPEIRGAKGFVYRVDGQVTEALQNFTYISYMRWLNQAEHLLVVAGKLPVEVDGETVEQSIYAVIDVEADEILDYAEMPLHTSSVLHFGKNIAIWEYAWRGAPVEDVPLYIIAEDGTLTAHMTKNYADVRFFDDERFLVSDNSGLYSLTADGTRTDVLEPEQTWDYVAKTWAYEGHLFIETNKFLWHWYDGEITNLGNEENSARLVKPQIYANQILVNMADQGLALYNITTHDIKPIAESTIQAHWSNTGRYILIWENVDDFTKQLSLYDVETDETVELSANGLEAEDYFISTRGPDYIHWFDPTDKFLIYATWDGLVLRDLASGQEVLYETERHLTENYVQVGSWIASQPINIYWHKDAARIVQREFANEEDEYYPYFSIYEIDVNTKDLVLAETQLLYGDDQLGIRLLEESSLNQSEIIFWDNPSPQWEYAQFYAWTFPEDRPGFISGDARGDWAIITMRTSWNLDRHYPFQSITNGSITRDLGIDCEFGRCATWLAEQVDVKQLPAQQQALITEAVLSHDNIVRAVAWSPGGTQIAVVWGESIFFDTLDKHQYLTIWDVATQTQFNTYPLASYHTMGGVLWNEQGLFVGCFNYQGEGQYDIYKLEDDAFELYPIEIEEDITPTSIAMTINIFEYSYTVSHGVVYFSDETAMTTPFDYFASLPLGYSTSDGQGYYQLQAEDGDENLSIFDIQNGEQVGTYPNWVDTTYIPNEKRFAVSANQEYVALASSSSPLQILSSEGFVAGDIYYPWALSFHPIEAGRLAIASSNQVEIVTIPQD